MTSPEINVGAFENPGGGAWVTLDVTATHGAQACANLTPERARTVAAALLHAADLADDAMPESGCGAAGEEVMGA